MPERECFDNLGAVRAIYNHYCLSSGATGSKSNVFYSYQLVFTIRTGLFAYAYVNLSRKYAMEAELIHHVSGKFDSLANIKRHLRVLSSVPFFVKLCLNSIMISTLNLFFLCLLLRLVEQPWWQLPIEDQMRRTAGE